MFEDIRPYRDDEVVAVVKSLVNEREFQASIASYGLPRLYKRFPALARMLATLWIKIRMGRFTCVTSLQKEVARYLLSLLKRSTDGFTYSGLEDLDLSKEMLFVSNHRDIALDPALVNLALSQSGVQTAEIAIGDNLLSKPWISDLMRLNKSFVVKRSEKSKRAMLAASKQLSAYVHHTITDKKHNVWIAQREGRAKDGIDKTNSAVISMLLLNKPKEMLISEYLQKLNIVPVSISYEFDPCDRDKARELAAIETTGCYQKSEHEDIKSITRGILGYKGHVHLQFGKPVKGEFSDSKAVAEAIDQQIISNYKLFENNRVAFAYSNNEDANASILQKLQQRMKDLDEVQRKWLIAMYANPAMSKKNATVSN